MDAISPEFAYLEDVRGYDPDEVAMAIAESTDLVAVHVFSHPRGPGGRHAFLHHAVRYAKTELTVEPTRLTAAVGEAREVFEAQADGPPLDIQVVSDRPYHSIDELIDLARTTLGDLRAVTVGHGLKRLVVRLGDEPEELVLPHALVVHAEGLFQIGRGWLARWDETADMTAPQLDDTSAELRVFAADGGFASVRIDFL